MSYVFAGSQYIVSTNTGVSGLDVDTHSWSVWLYVTAQPAGQVYVLSHQQQTGLTTYQRSLTCFPPAAAGYRSFGDQINSTTAGAWNSNVDNALNVWVQIGLTADGIMASPTFYANGSVVAATQDSVAAGSRLGGEHGLRIGTHPDGSGSYIGKIAELGFWNRALSASEWTALGTLNHAPSMYPDGLVYYLPLINDTVDRMGNTGVMTANGASVDAGHPVMVYPDSRVSAINAPIAGTY